MNAMIDYIRLEAIQCFESVKTAQCFKNFSEQTSKKQLEIIGRIAEIALLAGLFTGILCGSSIVGTVIALAAGFATFAYLTKDLLDDSRPEGTPFKVREL